MNKKTTKINNKGRKKYANRTRHDSKTIKTIN